jgi:hypothetical protein
MKSGDASSLSKSLREQLGLDLKAVVIDTLVIERADQPARVASI